MRWWQVTREIERLKEQMADLTTEIAKVTQDETDLEARVTAHEAKDAETVTTLQAEIDTLKKTNGDPTAIANLTALAAKIEAFDPSAPVPTPVPPTPVPVPPVVTPSAVVAPDTTTT